MEWTNTVLGCDWKNMTRDTYRQFSSDYIATWTNVFIALKRIVVLAEKMSTIKQGSAFRDSISEFVHLASQY